MKKKTLLAMLLVSCFVLALKAAAIPALDVPFTAAEEPFAADASLLDASSPVLIYRNDFESESLAGTHYLENGNTENVDFELKNGITFASGEDTDGGHYAVLTTSSNGYPIIRLDLADSREGFYTVTFRLRVPAGQANMSRVRENFNQNNGAGAISATQADNPELASNNQYTKKDTWSTFAITSAASLAGLTSTEFLPAFWSGTPTAFEVDDFCVWYTPDGVLPDTVSIRFDESSYLYDYEAGELSWTPDSYADSLPADLTADWLSTVDLAAYEPVCAEDDISFYGWSTTPDGQNIVTAVKAEGDMTLYAVFAMGDSAQAVTFGEELLNLTFDAADSLLSGTTYTENGKTYTTRTGYFSSGYWTLEDGALVFEHGADDDTQIDWGAFAFFKPDDTTVFSRAGTYTVIADVKLETPADLKNIGYGFTYINPDTGKTATKLETYNITQSGSPYGNWWYSVKSNGTNDVTPDAWGVFFRTSGTNMAIAANTAYRFAIDNLRLYFVPAGKEQQAAAETYTATFDANSTALTIPAAHTGTALSHMTLADYVPTGVPTTKRFTGWSLTADGPILKDLYLTRDVTLYAVLEDRITVVHPAYGVQIYFEDFESFANGATPTGHDGAAYTLTGDTKTVQTVNGSKVLQITGTKKDGENKFGHGIEIGGLVYPGEGTYTFVWDLTMVDHKGYSNIVYKYYDADQSKTVQSALGANQSHYWSNGSIEAGEGYTVVGTREIAASELSGNSAWFTYAISGGDPGTYTVYIDNLAIYYKESVDLTSLDEYSIRTRGTKGLRFSAFITAEDKAKSSEYGFLVAEADKIGGDGSGLVFSDNVIGNTATTDDASHRDTITIGAADVPYLYRSAYIQGNDIDNGAPATVDGTNGFRFNAVLVNLTPERYHTDFVVRAYTRVNGIYFYATPRIKNLYDAAAASPDTENSYIQSILAYGND